jgi:hypothetical protein
LAPEIGFSFRRAAAGSENQSGAAIILIWFSSLLKLQELRGKIVESKKEGASDFGARSFGRILSFDAPISYTYPHQEKVIGELIRICRKRMTISVSSRLGYLPYWANPKKSIYFG